jgi:hypothetical protein
MVNEKRIGEQWERDQADRGCLDDCEPVWHLRQWIYLHGRSSSSSIHTLTPRLGRYAGIDYS